MSSPPTSPRPKRGVRNYIRDKYDRFVRSHSRSPSAEASAPGTYLGPPLPQTPTSSNLAPPTDEEAAALRFAQSRSTTSNLNARSENAQWSSLQTALQALHISAGVFPPLQSAVGALISCLDVLEVSSKHPECIVLHILYVQAASKNHQEYEDIATELKTLSQSLTRHIKESNSTRVSDCVANVAL